MDTSHNQVSMALAVGVQLISRWKFCNSLLNYAGQRQVIPSHDDVIKWKQFPRYWPFVRRIHRSPVNCPHKGQWCGTLMFSLICARINGWVNNREAGDLIRHPAHCDVMHMFSYILPKWGCRALVCVVLNVHIILALWEVTDWFLRRYTHIP